MKVFEVKIAKKRTTEGCGFVWPEWWKEVYESVNVMAYQDEGLAVEGAVCVCDDKTWELIAAKKDKAIALLTTAQANEKGRAWRPQVTSVTDEQKVLLIVAKAAQGTALTTDELKALDPEDDTPGVGKSRLFTIEDSLNAEA